MPPTTIHKSPPPLRLRKIAAGSKSPGLRGKTLAIGRPPQLAQAKVIRTQIAKLAEQLQALNVGDILQIVLPELSDTKSGRLDAQKVAGFMGVPPSG